MPSHDGNNAQESPDVAKMLVIDQPKPRSDSNTSGVPSGPSSNSRAGSRAPSADDVSSPDQRFVEPASAADGSHSTDEVVRDLDQTIADEADGLLEGVFESVEEVLNAVGESATIETGTKQSPAPADNTPPTDLLPARTDPANEAATEDHAAHDGHEVTEEDSVTDDASATDGDTSDDAAAEETPSEHAVDPVADAPSPPQSSEAAAEVETASHDAAAAEAAPAIDGKAETATPTPRGRRKWNLAAISGLWPVIISAVATTLTFLSYPMRFVPPSLRPVLDWLALSLVFWVPIVWVLAILLS
jgi:hypothetical protein